ncbi:hypothetical protein ACQVP2_27955 [Methylobacterium aquaticum]|jgi:hypothetical protein|uniref:DUF4238 domain-containing protein n=1 Tax=Methylobacterium aquaticum TaxID=270351 RepID=A0A0J6S0G1_9HYPH|nr:hypothetical protein [Methylobacterium aquaticum]KMO27032.1 hypothetical protein VP06_31990 [Methylobacterium aquaticum]
MAAIPNLYLKWRSFRELVGTPRSDAEIGNDLFGEGKDGPQKFSKLLYGDYACSLEIGEELAGFMNRRIEGVRQARGLPTLNRAPFRAADLDVSLHVFLRHLIQTAALEDDEALDRTQEALLAELAPGAGLRGPIRLVVERLSLERAFAPFRRSGGDGPVVFQVGKHKGSLAVLGATAAPALAYTFVARDPRPTGHRSWEINWNEAVFWLPSPSRPELVDGALLLMPPAPVSPEPGRFLVTTVLVWEEAARAQLDPRGESAPSADLDEAETSRFLTNLRRLQKRRPAAVTVLSAEYSVIL